MTRHSKTTRADNLNAASSPPVYPFTAIVGQDEMKLALILSVIEPSLGGVLLMGHRGTGKSTAVRSLAALLPPMNTVRGCFYNCDPEDVERLCVECRARLMVTDRLPREKATAPIITLPLGATEDRVCGSINFERALSEGVKTFEPGLLARANRGFLYIDEVNLLEDHLVDLLLDVVATGRNVVEREGISTEHPARFVLVGSGNPEEGELRPQLLDRFGLYCEMRTSDDLEERVEIIERREKFDLDPVGFSREWEGEQSGLRRRLRRAQKHVRSVETPRPVLRFVAELCARLGVDGHRGEITITRAARALAAFEGEGVATTEHMRRIAALALRHRLRRDPLEQTPGGQRVGRVLEELTGKMEADGEGLAASSSQQTSFGDSSSNESNARPGENKDEKRSEGSVAERRRENDSTVNPRKQDGRQQKHIAPTDGHLPEGITRAESRTKKIPSARLSFAGRRTGAKSSGTGTYGRYARAIVQKPAHARIALDATFRAAVSYQLLRGREAHSPLVKVAAEDLRYKQFRRKSGTLFVLAVDTSGSMAANRIGQAKGALAQLLRQAYVNRDRVALVSFRAQGATLQLAPSHSTARAGSILNNLPIGGATPLAAGLVRALEVARRAAREGTEQIELLVFTDGRANVPLYQCDSEDQTILKRRIVAELSRVGAELRQSGIRTIIIDTQQRWTSGGEGQTLAEAVGGRYVSLPFGVSQSPISDFSGAL
ncbi:MAG: magnesium chelatase ATPase subunit I [Acidobacteriota bacterium]|nr:magnesium chelatase ATPase subunit I [Acidobacteriota bacterium]